MPFPRLVNARPNFGSKAPITEALIDIRVRDRPGEVDVVALRNFGQVLEGFSKTLEQREFEGRFSNDAPLVTREGVRGYLFLNGDDSRAVQARRDGFTYSRFHGYTCWEDLRDEARPIWERYVDANQPSETTRLALRYINRIAVPVGDWLFSDWFRIHPAMPPQLGVMSDFFMRVVVPHLHEPGYLAVLTFAVAPPDGTGVPAILYDIEVSTEKSSAPRSEDIWEVFENLRDFKNDMFLGFLGPKLKERLSNAI